MRQDLPPRHARLLRGLLLLSFGPAVSSCRPRDEEQQTQLHSLLRV